MTEIIISCFGAMIPSAFNSLLTAFDRLVTFIWLADVRARTTDGEVQRESGHRERSDSLSAGSAATSSSSGLDSDDDTAEPPPLEIDEILTRGAVKCVACSLAYSQSDIVHSLVVAIAMHVPCHCKSMDLHAGYKESMDTMLSSRVAERGQVLPDGLLLCKLMSKWPVS